MPSVDENREKWDQRWEWAQSGDEWSTEWGGSEMLWNFSLLPRIGQFLPTGRILEIAPGFGRWTQFLKDLCDELVVVDLSERCIEACKERFAADTNIEYFVNDGSSLEMVADDSIDFIFTFDSLVHVEPEVVSAYVQQLATKLTPNGVGVMHHSNLREHSRFLSRMSRDGWAKPLFTLAKVHPIHRSWRSPRMSADLFVTFAEQAGLQTIGQEKVNWSCRRTIDCLSTFTKPGSKWASSNVVVENPRFMAEAGYVRGLAPIYSRWHRDGGRSG